MQAIVERLKLHCPAPQTPARLVNRLLSDLVEPRLRQPTFLMDPPLFTSPLAKEHPDQVRDFHPLTHT